MITMGEVMAYLSDPRNARVRDLNEVKRMLADLVVGTSAKAKSHGKQLRIGFGEMAYQQGF